MHKLIKIGFVVSFVFFLNPIFSQSEYNKVKIIVIDAGHGGFDPGALGKKSKEKDITLAIALKTGKYIEENLNDVKVIFTRSTDEFIELYKRSEIANTNNADLFISIHVDAGTLPGISGTSSFVMGLNKADKQLEVVKRENAVIMIEEDYEKKYDGFDPNSPESEIIFSLYQNAYLEQSIKLAELVQFQFREKAKRVDRDVRQAGLVVLWNCSMPSILIETGFITNPEEESFLNSEEGQSIIASAIFRAVRSYKNYIENSEEELEKNIIFKLQIAYSTKNIETKPENFNGIEQVEKMEDGKYYRYFTGNTKTYEEIDVLQQKIKKIIPEAYVVAFNNGKMITVKDALQLLNN
jgi:N-acetylmuramoyl-L-alanine amidase